MICYDNLSSFAEIKMPFGHKPCCVSCKATSAPLWRKDVDGGIICDSCVNKPEKEDSENGSNHSWKPSASHRDHRSAVGSHYVGPIRKSARLKPSKHKYQGAVAKTFATKGKSRRIIFKKNPIKAASAVATVVSSDYLFHDGIYWQIGDIASVLDNDGGIYYVQLRGFLQDQYGVKSAVITWLIPTLESADEGFDPATFILGPEEDLPRKMDCFEFVCRSPSDYFRNSLSPYPTQCMQPDLGYVWTSMGEKIMPVPSNDEIYGLRKEESPEKIEKLTAKERRARKKEKAGNNAVKKEKKETAKERKEREMAATAATITPPPVQSMGVNAIGNGPKQKTTAGRKERVGRRERNKDVLK